MNVSNAQNLTSTTKEEGKFTFMETLGESVIQLADAHVSFYGHKIHRTSDILFSPEVPPNVNLSGPHRPVAEGDNITLTCNVTDGVPKPKLNHWLREKISLDEKNTAIVLRSIRKDQEGTYTCQASNKGGSANDSINVVVDSKTLKFC